MESHPYSQQPRGELDEQSQSNRTTDMSCADCNSDAHDNSRPGLQCQPHTYPAPHCYCDHPAPHLSLALGGDIQNRRWSSDGHNSRGIKTDRKEVKGSSLGYLHTVLKMALTSNVGVDVLRSLCALPEDAMGHALQSLNSEDLHLLAAKVKLLGSLCGESCECFKS